MGCRSFWIVCSLVAAGLVSGCASLRVPSPLEPLERRYLYYPAAYPVGDWQPAGLAFEDAWFAAADGTRLHGWYVPRPDPRAVVLYLHGNAGNLSHRVDILRRINERYQATVMIFDYRGYGRSEGTPGEKGLLQDARAAKAWLARRAGVPEADIVLLGRSLGGAVAVVLAAEGGARGLVLESTFTSVPELAKHYLPLLPARLLMQNRFDSLSKIAAFNGPLLQSHGTADRVIPYKLGRKLFQAAGDPKRFVTIRGGDHNDPQGEEYYRVLDEFIASLPPGGSSGSAWDPAVMETARLPIRR